MNDEILGELQKKDETYYYDYRTSKELEGEKFDIWIRGGNGEEKRLEIARNIYTNFKSVLSQMKETVKNDFYNDDVWNEDRLVSEQDILNNIRLETITIKDEIEYWFSDGNLFGGHSLIVHCNLYNEVQYVDIVG